MKLVIMSAQPLSELTQWAQKYFSDIPNRHAQKPEYDDFYLEKNASQRLHFVKSITDIEVMTILFNIPDSKPFWKSKPISILGRLLGDEGKGSLLSYLKQQGWALELDAGENFWRSFSLSITLTPEGYKNKDKVLAAVNAYIELIQSKGYPEYLFSDEKAIRQIALENLEPSSSGGRAAEFASSMTEYPVDEFLERNYLITDYSQEDFKKFVSYLNWSNAHVFIQSKNEKTNKQEGIFGIQYRTETLGEDFKKSLDKQSPVFVYAPKNKYIPDDFSLVTQKKQIELPQKDTIADKGPLYSQVDTDLGVAKASISIRILSSVDEGAMSGILLTLYSLAKDEELREWSYPISEAGASYRINTGNEAGSEIYLGVSGYSQRLDQILSDLILDENNSRRIDEVHISEKIFEDMKQRYKRDLQNIDESVASQRLGIESRNFLSNKSVHWREVLPLMDKIKLKDVQDFAKKFFKQASTQTVAYGNIRKNDVEKSINQLFSKLNISVWPEDEVQKRHLQYRLIPVKKEYSVPVLGKNNNHAAFSLYRVTDWTLESHAKIILLGQILAQPYFSELRTNQQLGYVANANSSVSSGYVGISTMLQSGKYPSLELQKRSKKFLFEFLEKKAESLTDEELKPIKESALTELLIIPNTLNERIGEFSQMAIRYEGRFSFRRELADQVKKLTATDIKNFIKDNFIQKTPALLTFYYYGQGAKLNKKDLPGTVLDKWSDTKDWDYIYPYNK